MVLLLNADTTDLIPQIRRIAATKLQELRATLPQNEESATVPSWVQQHNQNNTNNTINTNDNNNTNDSGSGSCCHEPRRERSEQCLFFDATGFIHIPGFVAADVIRDMKREIHNMVETQWDITASAGDTFGTNETQNIARGDYFLTSANRVHFFTEPNAMQDVVVEDAADDTNTKNQQLQPQRQQLKPEYRTPQNKINALNKIGHGLHLIPDSSFQRYTRSDPVRQLLQNLGWRDPVVPQSMYIFKQPRGVGGIVHSHQDATFLYTDPYPTCIGLWLALDDATLENGCLWVRPGSHNNTNSKVRAERTRVETLNVRRHYRRNVRHFGEEAIRQRSFTPTGDTIDAPMFEMVSLFTDPTVPWDGSLPRRRTTTTTKNDNDDDDGNDDDFGTYESLIEAGFIPIECQAGDLLAFAGTLDHLSLGNRCCCHDDQSPATLSSRHTFQLHIVEGPSQGVEWSPYNWLQYPNNEPFLRLNDNDGVSRTNVPE